MTRIRTLACCFLFSACVSGAPVESMAPRATPIVAAPIAEPAIEPRVVLMPDARDEVTVRVELARTREQRARGLRLRTRLAPDAGMLFLYRSSGHRSFWMRDTLLPLDIVFITSELRVLGVVESAEPRTDDARAVPGLAQHVLEVNGGFAQAHGIEPGTAVRFEGIPNLPAPNPERGALED